MCHCNGTKGTEQMLLSPAPTFQVTQIADGAAVAVYGPFASAHAASVFSKAVALALAYGPDTIAEYGECKVQPARDYCRAFELAYEPKYRGEDGETFATGIVFVCDEMHPVAVTLSLAA